MNHNKFTPIISQLINTANHSTLNSKLAAVIIKGTKILSKPCTNIERNTCRGNICGSLHAEAHAILLYFGRDLSYDPKTGWYIFQQNEKEHFK
jgi:hypothetical protein